DDAQSLTALQNGDYWIIVAPPVAAYLRLNTNVPVARAKSSKIKSLLSREGYCVLKNNPHMDAALEYMNWFFQPGGKVIESFAKANGQVPADSKAQADPRIYDIYLRPGTDEITKYGYRPDPLAMINNLPAFT